METPTRISASSTTIHGIDLAGLFVGDTAAEVAYYRDILGIAPTLVDDEGRGAEFTLADGSTIGVWNPGDAGTRGSITFFAVADARGAIEAIRARGGTIGDAQESPVCVMGWGADPDGNAFCVHQRLVAHEASAPVEIADDAIGGLDMTGVLVTDVERAIAFYRDVLGMTPTELDPQGRGAEFTLADGATFGVLNPGVPDLPPAGLGMLAVRDARAAVARIRSRGGTIADPMESPVCFMAFGTDPDGYGVCIHQRKTRD
jgi:predicted enzyme related to lactoylglutathione lyase